MLLLLDMYPSFDPDASCCTTRVNDTDWGVPRVIRWHVVHKIVAHTLQRHCRVPPSRVVSPWQCLDALLEDAAVIKSALTGRQSGNGRGASGSACWGAHMVSSALWVCVCVSTVCCIPSPTTHRVACAKHDWMLLPPVLHVL